MEKKFLKFFQFASEATQWFVFVFFVGIFLFALFQSDGVVQTAGPVPKHTPNIITYQGKVMENSLAVTTTKAFGFFIFDASSGGNLLYTASGTLSSTNTLSIVPSQGIFSVDLGGSGTNELTSSTFSNNTNIYLEVWVGGTKLTPRKQLTAAPFALNSQFLMGITATTTSSGLYIPHSDSNGNFAFTGTPQSSGVGGGVIYVNPGSADDEETLFGVAVNGTDKFRVDEDGDVWVNGSVTVTSSLVVNGSTTMNTSTLNADLIVKNGTNYVFYTDRINQRVGIASSSPSFPLSVVGESYFSATSTLQDVSVLDGIVLGGTKKSSWSSFAFLASDQTFTGANTFSGNNIFGGTNSSNIFSVTTTLASTTLNGNLNVDSGTFYVDALNNRVGVNTSTPSPYNLSVDGTSYFTGTTTLNGLLKVEGRVGAPVTLASHLGGSYVQGIFVSGHYAYAASVDGFFIVDVSNPKSLNTVATVSGASNCVQVSGKYAYTCAGATGVRIIDISNPKSPFIVATYNTAGSANNLRVDGNYVYLADDSNSLVVLDVSRPNNPTLVTTVATAGAAGDIEIQGHYAYVADNAAGGIDIFDIAEPQAPRFVGGVDPHGFSIGVSVFGGYAYLSEGAGVLSVMDVSDPTTPSEVASLSLSSPSRNFIAFPYLYVANSGNGLSILDVSTPSSPTLVTTTAVGNVQDVQVIGNYAYVALGDGMKVLDVSGAVISNASIGSASVSQLSVLGSSKFSNNIRADGGLTVGNSGLSLHGEFGMIATTTNNGVATNTLNFSHTAQFRSYASSTANRQFIFDTINTFSHTASSTYLLSVRNNGLKAFSVASNGDVAVSSTLYAGSATIGTPGSPGDLAERVDIAVDDTVEPGDVVIVDSENSDTYRRSQVSYEQSVAGVISTNPSLVIGFGQTQNTAVLAMVGRVPIKVSDENGPVHRGDILVSASEPGYAMRYDATKDDDTKIIGIIGVALESLEMGKGKIMGLVRTGWVNSRHKTIADIQQELLQLAEAQSASQSNGALNVVDQNGQLTFLNQDLDANGKSIFNIGRLAGKDGKWEVDADGRFITRLTTSDGEKSLYSLQSGETEYVFSGSAQLQGGVARVDFDTINQEIIDPEKPMKINITLTSEANGVYISGKDGTGFVVKELQNGTSNASFDYVVIATRKMPQENLVVEPVNNAEAEDEGAVEPVPPPVDESPEENAEPVPPVEEVPPPQEVEEEQSSGGQEDIAPEGEASEPASP